MAVRYCGAVTNVLRYVCAVATGSWRICALQEEDKTEDINLLLINVHLSFEDGNARTDESTIIEDVIERNPDFYVILGGDFNVDFSRDRFHTTLFNKFCQENDIVPVLKHTNYCSVDYTYQFNMSRFIVLDHFVVSEFMFK